MLFSARLSLRFERLLRLPTALELDGDCHTEIRRSRTLRADKLGAGSVEMR